MSNNTALQVILFVYTTTAVFVEVGKSRTLRDSKLASDATAYRTYLNVVGALNCWGYSGGPCGGLTKVKSLKTHLKILFFKRETQTQKTGRGWETVTGAGTGNVFDPSNAGYPPLVYV
jgi:hypothetical protein